MKNNGTIQRSTKNDSKLFTIKDKKTRMDNPETQATLGRQTKQKTQH